MSYYLNKARGLKTAGSLLSTLPKIKFVLYALFTIGVFFPLYRFLRNQDAKNRAQKAEMQEKQQESAVKDPQVQTKEALAITHNTALHGIAKNVAHHLGFIYEWWDPRRWTENDLAIYSEMRKMTTRAQLEQVKQLYFKVYAVGRNLQDDCRAVLDSMYYNKINW